MEVEYRSLPMNRSFQEKIAGFSELTWIARVQSLCRLKPWSWSIPAGDSIDVWKPLLPLHRNLRNRSVRDKW